MPFRWRQYWQAACLAFGMAMSLPCGAAARVAGANAAASLSLSIPGGRLVVAQHGAVTTVAVSKGLITSTGRLPPNDMISAGTLVSARVIGLPRTGAVLIETTYASQTGIGGPQVQCAAGQESILRVVAVASRPCQKAEMRVTSCWNDKYSTFVTWIATTAR